MSRRLFFERIAALFAGAMGAPLAQAAPVQPAPSVLTGRTNVAAGVESAAPASRLVELQRSPVAGFQYHQGEAVWPMLTVGASLALVRETENVYDSRAVRVDWRGRKLGYVPRVDNAAISHLLECGELVTAEVVALNLSNDPWDRIEFAVYLKL